MKQYIALTLLSATIDWKKPRVLVLAGEGRGRNTRVPEFSSAVDGNHHILAHVYCGLPESDKRLVLWRGIRKLEDDQASDAPHQLLHLTQAREKNG